MATPTLTQIVQEVDNLPDELQQQVLQFIRTLRQTHQTPPGNAWDTLETLTGTVEAPTDWSTQHDHYLFGSQSRQGSRFVADMLTVTASLQAQGRSTFDWLSLAFLVLRSDSPAPSLIPDSSLSACCDSLW